MKTSKRFLAIAMTSVMVASMAMPALANSKKRAYSETAAAEANNFHEALVAAWNAEHGAEVASDLATAAGKVITSEALAAAANNTVTLSPEELVGNLVVKAPIMDSATAAALANAAREMIG